MCRIAANVSKPMYRCAFNRGASSFNQKIVWAICPRLCLKISLSMVIVTDRNLCLSGNVGWNYCWQHWFEISSMLDFSGLTLLFCMELSQWTDHTLLYCYAPCYFFIWNLASDYVTLTKYLILIWPFDFQMFWALVDVGVRSRLVYMYQCGTCTWARL